LQQLSKPWKYCKSVCKNIDSSVLMNTNFKEKVIAEKTVIAELGEF
jgi:hypothetical protein